MLSAFLPLGLLALVQPADAATVAVLSFDAYGPSAEDADTVTQGLRDAFLAEEGLNPLTATDIAAGLTGPHAADLATARDRIAEARRDYQAHDAEAALPILEEGLDLHYQAHSEESRRAELADAWYLKALCAYATGDDAGAQEAFGEATFLFPKYIKDRATSLPSGAIGTAAAAQAAMETGRKRLRSLDYVQEVGSTLGVEYVVVGWVGGDGTVAARIYEGGKLVGEERTKLSEMPALPVDDAFATLAAALARDARGEQAEAAAPEAVPAAPTPRYGVETEPAKAIKTARAEPKPVAEEPAEPSPKAEPKPTKAAKATPPDDEPEVAVQPKVAKPKPAPEPKATKTAKAPPPEDEPEVAAQPKNTAQPKATKPTPAAKTASTPKSTKAPTTASTAHSSGDRAPITKQWWFWTAAAAGAGGVAAAIGFASYDPEPVEVPGAPTWSVEVSN